MSLSRQQLIELTNQFVDAFNRCDLDGVMAFFTDDAVYEDLATVSYQGETEIRAALLPYFDGTFGRVEFIPEDLVVDADGAKVMTSWCCNMQLGENPTSLRGLDVLHFEGKKLKRKVPYSKTSEPLFQ